MPGGWLGLNTALSALTASQLALDTAAHNTANTNTEGYSRQRVNLVESPPFSYPAFNRSGLPGQLGTGVSVATIERVRDAFLDLQIRSQFALQGQWQTRSDELAKVESAFPEPNGSGIGTALNAFWNAWQDLASDPTSPAARSALVGQAGTLTQQFSSAASQIGALIDGVDYQVGQQVAQVNTLAAQVAALNAQIQRVTVTGDHPNDLSDQRDLLLDQLSRIAPITTVANADGTVTVLVGGTDLVEHDKARAMTTTPDVNGHAVPTWSSGGNVALGPSQLASLVSVRDTTLAGYLGQLNLLAKGVADSVNALQNPTPPGGGNDVFTYSSGSEAKTIAVNAVLVADPSLLVAGAAGSPGDGSLAAQIADLRNAQNFAGGTQTAGDFYASLIGTIGSDAQQANAMASNEGLVVSQLTTRRASVSGVSLDEEATDMIRFQRAYQAAARVITIVDETLDTLINRTGLVGR
jgi:flagellar hook-associated protein 1 FlgK